MTSSVAPVGGPFTFAPERLDEHGVYLFVQSADDCHKRVRSFQSAPVYRYHCRHTGENSR